MTAVIGAVETFDRFPDGHFFQKITLATTDATIPTTTMMPVALDKAADGVAPRT